MQLTVVPRLSRVVLAVMVAVAVALGFAAPTANVALAQSSGSRSGHSCSAATVHGAARHKKCGSTKDRKAKHTKAKKHKKRKKIKNRKKLKSAAPIKRASAPRSGVVAVGPFATLSPTIMTTARTALNDVYEQLVNKWRSEDPYFWDGSSLQTGLTTCLRCQIGPALVAATKWRVDGSVDAADKAISTIDLLIAREAKPDGSFGPPRGPEGGPDIQTSLFATQLGRAITLLQPLLPQSTLAHWREVVVKAAAWLIRNGNLQWYTNGNIVLANALVMLYAAKLGPAGTSAYYAQKYDEGMDFAIAPPQRRWSGFGFKWIQKPTDSTGSNGVGYLAESGGGSPGLDLDYAGMQANVLATMATITSDVRVVQMLNGLRNLILKYTNESTWYYETGGGSRHTEKNRSIPLLWNAMTIGWRLRVSSANTDEITSYDKFLRTEFIIGANFVNPGMAYAFGTVFAETIGLLLVPKTMVTLR